MNLVLSHGFFGFASIGPVSYFNRVKDHLAARFPGIRILVPTVPPDGTIAVRGTALAQQIDQALTDGTFDSGQTVHIIAHSMGGLDSRFILSPDNPANMADRIASLTTISTPHQGTPAADVLVELRDSIDPGEIALGHALSAALAHAHVPVGGLENLTSAGARKFNDTFRDNDGTKKFSVAGVGRGIKVFGIHVDTCLVLRLPYRIIKERTGEENDGLVSLSSATWGSGPELWPADHADEIGHNLDLGLQAAPTQFDHLKKYEALVDRLTQL